HIDVERRSVGAGNDAAYPAGHSDCRPIGGVRNIDGKDIDHTLVIVNGIDEARRIQLLIDVGLRAHGVDALEFNRIAYGPTPDELERVNAMGPQAYINEQLNPASLVNPIDDYESVIDVLPVNVPHTTNWTTITVTGRVSGVVAGTDRSPFYIYMTGAGNAYVDDIQLSVIYTNYTEMYVTNATNASLITTNLVPSSFYLGTNLISNGDFESSLTGPWVLAANHSGSSIVGSPKASGSGSLHVMA